jgi:hypothetical protein
VETSFGCTFNHSGHFTEVTLLQDTPHSASEVEQDTTEEKVDFVSLDRKNTHSLLLRKSHKRTFR